MKDFMTISMPHSEVTHDRTAGEAGRVRRWNVTIQELHALSDRDLDALIAEKLFDWTWWYRPTDDCDTKEAIRKAIFPPERDGWVRGNFSTKVFSPVKEGSSICRFSDWDRTCWNDGTKQFGLPHWSTDLNLAAEAECKLLESDSKDDWDDYLACLSSAIDGIYCALGSQIDADLVPPMVTATARQRCIACLLFLEDER